MAELPVKWQETGAKRRFTASSVRVILTKTDTLSSLDDGKRITPDEETVKVARKAGLGEKKPKAGKYTRQSQ
ncbi:MAG: hypothetical protein J6Y33_01525 [Prevotella sp.]|nr:hypothetical protein [Prevotella sp.]